MKALLYVPTTIGNVLIEEMDVDELPPTMNLQQRGSAKRNTFTKVGGLDDDFAIYMLQERNML